MIESLPLNGIRILSAEQYGAGPYGSMMLADLGAEVIKIENPRDDGDISRQTGPYPIPTADGTPDSQFFQSFNSNKKSLTLDLKSDSGQEIFHKLAGTADAVMNNLRGDQPARLGLDYASLATIKPSLVCAHLSAYGRDNERYNWPGYDYLMQAEAGYLHLTGEPDSPPTRMGLSIVDYMTGITTATGLLAALIGAKKTGAGRDVDVSLFDVALAQLTYPAAWYLNSAHVTERIARSAHPSTVPCQLVKSADGWLFLMCMTPRFWQRLCEGIDHAEWLTDKRFTDAQKRLQHRDALSQLLDTAFSTQTTKHWLSHFQGSIPISPVLHLSQALDNPFAHTAGMIGNVTSPDGTTLSMVSNPVKIDGNRLPRKTCSTLSADTRELLSEVGYSNNQIDSFRHQGVV